jgi:hypothetical protein
MKSTFPWKLALLLQVCVCASSSVGVGLSILPSNARVLGDDLSQAAVVSEEQWSVQSLQQRFTVGSFGYETFVNHTCVDEYVYIYGYGLGECSSTSASTSLRYDWCGVGDDGFVYFNMVRYNSINCVGIPSWNFTYSVSQSCNTANARKPLCTGDVNGWRSYGLKQHSM